MTVYPYQHTKRSIIESFSIYICKNNQTDPQGEKHHFLNAYILCISKIIILLTSVSISAHSFHNAPNK